MNESILISNLTKKFKDKTALKEISFSINSGEIFGFLGHLVLAKLRQSIF